MIETNKPKGTCSCGRTANPNGNCDGSHGLTEAAWIQIKYDRHIQTLLDIATEHNQPQSGGGSTSK